MHEMAIRGARLVGRDGVAIREVGIDGGRISAVDDEVEPAMIEFDGEGLLLLPGLIDDHVHFREPGMEVKEDFASGSRAAAHGGATTVFEIQNNAPLMTSRAAVESKLAVVRPKSRVNVGVYGSANASSAGRLAEMADLVMGFKVFLAPSHGDEGVDSDLTLRTIFQEITRLGKIAVIHAEDRSTIAAGLEAYGKLGARGWSRARSAAAEVKACERAIRLAETLGTRIHLFHLSSAGAVDLVEEAKGRGLSVTAATCPHYLLFTDDDVERLGGLLKCNPSIKTAVDRARLREGVRDGIIDVIETDHAPHRPAEKLAPFERNPSGISSADVFLPLLFRLIEEGVLTLRSLVERCCLAPARIYGLQGKGWIERGTDADLVLVDDRARWTPTADEFASKANVSPFVGMHLPARVVTTWVGGRVAWSDRPEP